MAGNVRLLRAAARYDGPFDVVVVPIINPSLAAWREHVEACLMGRCKDGGQGDTARTASCVSHFVRGIKILPNYHAYSVMDSSVHQLAEMLADRGLVLSIQVRMNDERSHHPMMKVPAVPAAEIAQLAAAHPQLDILVCGAYMGELARYNESPNVGVELSFVETGKGLAAALEVIPASRLLFGSHAPLHYVAAGTVKVGEDGVAGDITDEVRGMVARGNYGRLFGRSA